MRPESPLESAYAAMARHREIAERGAVVAVSGGIDSVVMLHLAVRLAKKSGRCLVAAHYDHGIRGDASRADRDFVVSLCDSWDVPCLVGEGNVPSLRAEEAGNLEAIARRERYRFLAGVVRGEGLAVLLTAHTADDRVETMLMNLLRGAGPRGLAGIRETAELEGVAVYRPLLNVWRADISSYAVEHGLQFREDATNQDTRLLRNWVRLELLPRLESRIPAVRENLLREARILENEDDRLTAESIRFCEEHGSTAESGEIFLPVEGLLEIDDWLLHGVLRHSLERSRPGKRIRHAEAVFALAEKLSSPRTTWDLDLPGGFRVRREYDRLVFAAPPDTPDWGSVRLAVPGEARIPEIGVTIRVETSGNSEAKRSRPAAAECFEASFDLDRLPGPLMVRPFRPGDRLQPSGMEGSRKIKRIFSDRKVPRWQRARVPILCSGDQPIWAVGYRLDGRYLVGDDTRRAAHVSVFSSTGTEDGD